MEPVALDPRVAAGTRRQLEAWRAALDAGAQRLGWKIGFNPPAVMERLGIGAPVVGHLTTASAVVDGGEHSLAGTTSARVEPEVAIQVGGQAAADGWRVAALAPSLEVVDVDRPPSDLEDIVATNIYHRAVVLGQAGAPDRGRRGEGVLPSLGGQGVLSVDGEAVHRFDLAATATDPRETIDVVARTLAACGGSLRVGDWIIAGSLTEQVEVAPGDSVALELGSLGSVAVRLSA